VHILVIATGASLGRVVTGIWLGTMYILYVCSAGGKLSAHSETIHTEQV
jgi:hypothetical protein